MESPEAKREAERKLRERRKMQLEINEALRIAGISKTDTAATPTESLHNAIFTMNAFTKAHPNFVAINRLDDSRGILQVAIIDSKHFANQNISIMSKKSMLLPGKHVAAYDEHRQWKVYEDTNFHLSSENIAASNWNANTIIGSPDSVMNFCFPQSDRRRDLRHYIHYELTRSDSSISAEQNEVVNSIFQFISSGI